MGCPKAATSDWRKKMAMIELKLDPSKRDLNMFGLMLVGFVALLGGLIWWKFESLRAAQYVWGVGGVLAVVYFLAPPLRLPIYKGWMYAAFPIGWTISHIVMAATFYLVITPIGLIMRLVGRDPMHRKPDPSLTSYWTTYPQARDPKRYFRQF